MALEIGALRALLSLDSAGFVRGASRGERAMDGLNRSFAKTDGVAKKSMRGVERSMARIEARARKAARGMRTAMAQAAGTLALGLGGLNVTQTLRGFESGMARVKAISGATGAEIKSLRDMAKSLGATTEFSATQVAGGMQFLGQAGFDAAETLEAIPTVLDLATASAVDMATAADIASNILGGFGKEASDLPGIADVLAKTTSSSNTDLRQLGDALSYAAPLAKAAGVSVEEAAAAVGKLSDAGIQGSRAGTSLSGVIRRLQNPSAGARAAIADLGLSMEDVDLKGESLAEVMALFAERGMTAAQAAKIFEAEAAPGALVMAANAEAIGEFAGELQNADGALSDMTKTMRGTIDGAFKGLGSAVEGLVIELGDAGLTRTIKGVAESFTAVVRGISQMPDLGPVAAGFAIVAASAVALASPLAAVAGAFVGLAAGAAALYANWDQFAASFPGIAGVISGAVDGVRQAFGYIGARAQEGMAALNAAFSGQGTEALKLYLSALVSDARAFGSDLAASMLEAGQGAVRNLSAAFSEFDFEQAAIDGLNAAAQAIERLTGIKAPDSTRIGTFVTIVADAVRGVKETAGAVLSGLASGVRAFLEALQGRSVAAGFAENLAGGLSALGDAASVGLSLMSAQIGPLSDGFKVLFSIWNQGAADGFAAWLGDLAGKGLTAIGVGFEGLAHGLNLVVQAVGAFASGDWSGFAAARKEFAAFLSLDGENLARISAAQAAAISGNWKAALEIIRGVRETSALTKAEMVQAAEGVAETMKPGFDRNSLDMAIAEYKAGVETLEGLRARVEELRAQNSGVGNAVLEGFTGDNGSAALNEVLALIGRVDTEAGAARQKISDLGTQAEGVKASVAAVSQEVEKIGASAETAKTNLAHLETAAAPIAQSVQAVASEANATLDGLVSDMGAKGVSGVAALASGISGGQGQITGAISTVTGAALSQLAGFGAEMERAGRQAMEGLAQGIVNAADQAADAAADAAQRVIKAAKDALDIRSPSREMAEVGRQSMAGVKQGLDEGASAAADAAGTAAGGVVARTVEVLRASAGAHRDAATAARERAQALLEAGRSASASATRTAAATARTAASAVEATRAASAVGKLAKTTGGVVGQTKGVSDVTLQATEAMKAFGNAGQDAAARVAKSMETAGKSVEKTGNGIMSVLDPIIAGFEKGDLSNIGHEFLAAARSSFFSSLRSWIGGLGRGGSGTLPGTSAPTSSLRPVGRGQAQGGGLLGGLFGGGRGLGGLFGGGGGGLGGLFNGIMPVIGAISTAINFFKTTTTQLDAGLRLTINGVDTLVESFETIEKIRFFGLSRKVSTDYKVSVGKAAHEIKKTVRLVQKSVQDTAEVLGIGADAFDGFTYRVQTSTKGMSQADAAEALKAEIEGLANAYAEFAIGSFNVIRDGETATETLEALAESLTTFNAGMENLGFSMLEASVLSADLARSITDSFGGVSEFTSGLEFYYARFYSEAERMENSLEKLTETLADAGITTIPRTHAQFRELVDVMGDAGLYRTVSELIRVAPLFEESLGAMATATTETIGDIYGQTRRLVERNISVVERALSRLDRRDGEAAESFAQALNLLRQGVDGEALSDAADTVSQISADMFGTAFEMRHAQNMARAALENIQINNTDEIDRLDAMVAGILEVDTSVLTVNSGIAMLNEQVEKLREIQGNSEPLPVSDLLEQARIQENIANLQAELARVMRIELPYVMGVNHINGSGGKHIVWFNDGHQIVSHAGSKNEALSKVMGQVNAHIASVANSKSGQAEGLRAQIRDLGGVPAFGKGGFHAGGLRLVGEGGMELEATGPARYYSAADTRNLLSGAGSSETVAELRALRAEVAQMRHEQKALGIRTSTDTRAIRKIEEAREVVGMPGERAQ